MRITNSMLVDTVINNLQQNVSILDQVQHQISSGKRVTKPSDDPTAAGLGIRLRNDSSANDQFDRNIEQARSWLTTSDSALDVATQALQRVRELAIQAANDTYSAQDRLAASQEINQLRDHVLMTFNSAMLVDQNIFAGKKTSVAPFVKDVNTGNVTFAAQAQVGIPSTSTDLVSATTGFVNTAKGIGDPAAPAVPGITGVATTPNGTYTITSSAGSSSGVKLQLYRAGILVDTADNIAVPSSGTISAVRFSTTGISFNVNSNLSTTSFTAGTTNTFTINDASLSREIGPNAQLQINVTGDQFLGLFTDLKTLADTIADPTKGNAAIMAAVSGQGGSSARPGLDADLNSILSVRADVGAKLNRLDFSQKRLQDTKIEVQRLQSTNEDLDFAEALTRMTTAQGVYRASLEAGARTAPMSILDFLK